jgi:uncharacterized protein YggE
MGSGQKLSVVLVVVLVAALVTTVVTLSVQAPRAAAAAARQADPAGREAPPTISVTANAIVKVQPDLAYFEVGILTQDKSAAKAQAVTDQTIARIMKTLQAKGVSRKDLATSVCTLRPSYADNRDRRTIIGYHADNFVTVNVRNLSRLGETIDACMTAGATNIGDVEFRVDDIRKYRAQAREMAARNARERAEQLAQATGVKIVQLISLSERTSDYPSRGWGWWQSRRDPMMSQAIAYASPEAVSEEPEIALGTFPITAGVSAAFEVV